MNSIRKIPLVVDLDGTLLRTDTLYESMLKLIKESPLNFIKIIQWLIKGRACLKEQTSLSVNIQIESIPYNIEFLEYLKSQKENGRKIILATAAHKLIAERISAHLNLFDAVLSTSGNINLKSEIKLRAIKELVGNDFVYAGNEIADLPIWKASKSAILVNASNSISKYVSKYVIIEREFKKDKISITELLNSIRIHQWSKNLLLFVPLIASFSSADISSLGLMTMAFFSYSLIASSAYIINDLLDLENDRAHPTKSVRAFASGRLQISTGGLMAVCLLMLGILTACSISTTYLLMLLLYFFMSILYSISLKKIMIIDVITLSMLYTNRIFAGSVVMGIKTSSWLLAFSFFLFFSLALVKRCEELMTLKKINKKTLNGRDYQYVDLKILCPLGVTSASSSIVVLCLFINNPETQIRYASPNLLWLVAVAITYWLARIWIITARGEMHHDPVFFAVSDKVSRNTIILIIIAIMISQFVA